MEHMFSCASLFNQPVHRWRTPKLENINNMFYAANSYTYPFIELCDNQLTYVLK
jgi:hypothetical protein